MRVNRQLEIGTGLFVLLGFAALLFLTTQLPNSGLKLGGGGGGYHVSAEFTNIGDLRVGAPVAIAGVNVGDVQRITYNPKTFKAVVTLRIDSKYREIPDDSYAIIQTQGLLGGKYVSLSPGGTDSYLKDGSEIAQTQSAIVLEDLINKLFTSFTSSASKSSESSEETQK
jgi:phospholipid/cholesterol/gamma-HCH transport system substrate-binding protein